MPDEDFFFDQMKQENGKSEENLNGWTDDEIRDDIASRSRIALSRDRKSIEAERVAKYQESIDARETEIRQAQRRELTLRQQEDDARLLQVETHFKENRNINGVDVGESDMANALEEFRVLNQLDENGEKPLLKMFENDNDLFKAYFLTRGDGTFVKEILSGMKSELAKNILDRTSLHSQSPNNQFGGVGQAIPTADDLLDF